jgi:heat shock transcription factor
MTLLIWCFSFLDDNKNTNLIRWSDDGNSFIVLDEDEFARTLIPELFKHNNYASFVRQLNMYGFHKKVGLSDNSMKASEMKSKAPSEYYNKYFKRGRPELLWLIQKPKNASHPKRKRDDDGKPDSEEERKYQDAGGSGGYGEDLAVRGNQDMAMIPRTEYNSLRNEVRALQQQQKAISQVLSSIRRQNDQLYQQATAFQTLHDRHENSINAILTFLATFYNRSLEGGSGTNLADLFHPSMAQQQPRGNVVDVDDFPEKDFKEFAKSPTMHMQRPNRRSLALLPAPVAKDGATKGDRAATLSPSILSTAGSPRSKSNVRPPPFKSPAMSRSTSSSAGLGSQPPTSGRVTTQTNIETPPAAQGPQPLAQNEEIMSHIQNVNAATSPATTQGSQLNDHLSAALASYQTQNGNLPLTPQQRNDMLSLMANNVSAASPTSSVAKNSNNAMVNPQPPAIPDLTELHETQNQLELLRRLSDGTSTRIQHLQERLQPLSPSGQIPGIGQDSYFDNVPLGDPSQYDLDMGSFVNDDFFPEGNPTVTDASATTSVPATAGQNGPLPATADPTETNPLAWDGFGVSGDAGNTGPAIHGADINNDELFGDNGANGDDGRFESLSSSTTSPSATADVLDDGEQQSIRSPKRMRK